MTDVGKKGRSTYRAAGKDVDFIPDVIRTKRTSAGRVREVLIEGLRCRWVGRGGVA